MKTKKINLFECPKCKGKTATYRHLFAKVWCVECGYVLREEGDQRIIHDPASKESTP